MGFTTQTFLFIFLPCSIIIYLAVQLLHRTWVSNLVLLAMSLGFYAWSGWDTLLFFVLLNVAVYLMGNLIYYAKRAEAGSRYLRLSVCLLILTLVYYKYAAFLLQELQLLTDWKLTFPEVVVPLGISFVIFTSVSYLMDIHRGDGTPGTLLETFLYLSLFPKLISGPIVRWKDLGPQLRDRRTDMASVTEGVHRIIIGFAKKAILADTFGARIALIDSGIAASGVDMPTMWLRALLYFFQIYYDFSGYSDIAIGLCRIFGFSLAENFNFPYLSRSITEFWRRWHISLGSWFREYVYIPLGGNRKGNVYVHLFVVFLLTGIWHGANWTFLLWGVYHGVFVVLERLIRNRRWYQKIPSPVKWLGTMVVVFFGWTLFMATDLTAAVDSWKSMFTPVDPSTVNFTWQYYLTFKTAVLLGIAAVGAVAGIGSIPDRVRQCTCTTAGALIQKAAYLMLFVVAVLFVVNSTYSPFLYFQF